MPAIHKTAWVDSGATLAADVVVGAFSVIGSSVVIGEGTEIGPHTRIEGNTIIGKGNRIYGQSSIGTDPQDVKFGGAPTRLEIGDGNVIREFVTINRGTDHGGGLTRIGDSNFLMAYAHIAHDCFIGNHVIFANAGTLAGHVTVGDHALVGAFTAIHQFCRIGKYAFTGGGTIATQDVLPFVKTVGARPPRTYGVNTIGLERKGFSKDVIAAIRRAYNIIRTSSTLREGVDKIHQELPDVEEARYLADFASEAKRGFIR